MVTGGRAVCSRCHAEFGSSFPFCPDCGEISPLVFSPGHYSVELDEVASKSTRTRLVALLVDWFPALDPVETERKLARGKAVLIRGLSRESATRIVENLKMLKIGASLAGRRPWTASLFNGGLIISGLALVPALFLGQFARFILFMVAVAGPVAGAILKERQLRPLIPTPPSSDPVTRRWIAMAEDYGEVISMLERPDAQLLKSVALSVFELSDGLSSDTLTAVAAGEETGELHARLEDTLRSAIAIARGVATASDEDEEGLRSDLASIEKLARSTLKWYRAEEMRDVKGVGQLSGQLAKVIESIDSIVGEVHTPGAKAWGDVIEE